MQQRCQAMDKVKTLNILLLKELKDIKIVVKECSLTLVDSNQNSEILEKLSLI